MNNCLDRSPMSQFFSDMSLTPQLAHSTSMQQLHYYLHLKKCNEGIDKESAFIGGNQTLVKFF